MSLKPGDIKIITLQLFFKTEHTFKFMFFIFWIIAPIIFENNGLKNKLWPVVLALTSSITSLNGE